MKRLKALLLASVVCIGMAVPAFAAEQERGVLTYSEVIAPQYEKALSFSGGLAAVKKDGKWGYIDTDGNTVIPFQYDIAFYFNEGLAVVGTKIESLEGYGEYSCKLGFINKENQLTWFDDSIDGQTDSFVVDYVYSSNEDLTGYERIFHNGYISLPSSGGFSLFTTNGKRANLPEAIATENCSWQVTEGIAIIGWTDTLEFGQDYYDIQTGKKIALPELALTDGQHGSLQLRPFNQGLAPVEQYISDWNTGTWSASTKWGFVDKNGKWVIQPAYADFMVQGLRGFYQVFGETGLAIMKNMQEKWGAINKQGQTVIPFEYDELRPYHFGLAAFKKDGKYGYLNAKGQVAIPAQYEMTGGFGSNGYAAAYNGNEMFLIDTKGAKISGTDKLDRDTYFVEQEDGSFVTFTPDEYVVISENGKYGFGRMEYLPPLPAQTELSSWAYEEVTAAIEENLVPSYMQNLYLNNITRDEFCDMVIQAVEEITDKDIEDVVQQKTGTALSAWQQKYPFIDTTNPNVIAANALGIIAGRGNGIFDPYSAITRQEAAALLMRCANVLGMDTGNAAQTTFSDNGNVAVYFRDAVNFVYQINVMSGTGNNQFNPLGTYTREQSYVTIHRLFQAIMKQ